MGRVIFLAGAADSQDGTPAPIDGHSRKPSRASPRLRLGVYAAALFLTGLAAPWLLGTWTKVNAIFASPVEFAGRASVIDGDTIEIRGARIRLHGIDAPESGQWCQYGSGEPYRCGQQAAQALAGRIEGRTVRCEILDRDRYGRHVGRCYAGGTDVNGWMVANGHAVAYRRYSSDYVAQESAARNERLGTWQGYFDLPWDWRSGDRRAAEGGRTVEVAARQSGSCDIKGNISGNGRIYHLPGQQFYDRTAVDPASGERWFCSEEEARAAGWRRALR